MTAKIVSDSAFGCAGQRCLAVATAITVGEASTHVSRGARRPRVGIRVGNGLEEGVGMGPVITPPAASRILGLIDKGVADGGKLLLDGRDAAIDKPEAGQLPQADRDQRHRSRQRPDDDGDLRPGAVAARSGRPRRGDRRHRARTPTATPRRSSRRAAPPPASSATRRRPATSASTSASPRRWPTSRSAAGRTASSASCTARGATRVEFYTDKKVVVERWPKEWSRKF